MSLKAQGAYEVYVEKGVGLWVFFQGFLGFFGVFGFPRLSILASLRCLPWLPWLPWLHRLPWPSKSDAEAGTRCSKRHIHRDVRRAPEDLVCCVATTGLLAALIRTHLKLAWGIPKSPWKSQKEGQQDQGTL